MYICVNATEYEIIGYQVYEEVFVKYTYMECHKDALSCLTDALADQQPLPGEEVKIVLDAEKAVTEIGTPCAGHIIHFLVKESEEGPLFVSYYYLESL